MHVLRSEGELFIIDKGLDNNEKLVLTLPEYPQEGMGVKLASNQSSSEFN